MITLYRKQLKFMILLIITIPIILFAGLAWYTYIFTQTLDSEVEKGALAISNTFAANLSGGLADRSTLQARVQDLQKREPGVKEITIYEQQSDSLTVVISSNEQKELEAFYSLNQSEAWRDDKAVTRLEPISGSSDLAWSVVTPIKNSEGSKIGLLATKISTEKMNTAVKNNYFQSFVGLIITILAMYAIIIGYFLSIRLTLRKLKLKRKGISNTLISEAASGFQLPIVNINKNYASLVHEGYDHLLDDKGEDYLVGLYNHSTVLAQISKDLLELNKILSGDSALHPTSVNPSRVVHELINSLQPYADDRKIQIIHNVPSQELMIGVDEQWLRRVLWTIFTIVLPRTSRGAVSIQYEHDTEKIVVTISSNSYSLHEPSEQPDQKTEGLHEAQFFSHLGVNFWIAQQVIRRMHGDLEAEFQLVQGVTFHLTLPNQSGMSKVNATEAHPPVETLVKSPTAN